MEKDVQKDKKPILKKTCPILNMSPKLILIHSFSFLIFLAIFTLCLFTISSHKETNLVLKNETNRINQQVEHLNNMLDENDEYIKSWNCNDPYNIFGQSRFDSAITGYLTTKTIEDSEMWQEHERAYLVITEFEDEGLEKSIRSEIEEEEENEDQYEDGHYLFNLGCFTNDNIKAEATSEYLDEQTLKAILESTPDNPVKVRLYFDFRLGVGCHCCNTAEKIRLEQ